MKPDALARWKDLRLRGRTRYILISGVLSYGFPMFIAMTFFVNRDDLSPGIIGISALLWAIGGAAFGAITWHTSERKYRKATKGNEA